MRNKPRVIHTPQVKQIQSQAKWNDQIWCEGMSDYFIKKHIGYMHLFPMQYVRYWKEWDGLLFYNKEHLFVYCIRKPYYDKISEQYSTFYADRFITRNNLMDLINTSDLLNPQYDPLMRQ